MERFGLHNDQWDRIKDVLPGREGHVGGTADDNRLFVEAVLYRFRTGCPWRDLPERFGKWNSVWKRFDRWARKGTWKVVFEALQDADLEYDPCEYGVLIQPIVAGLADAVYGSRFLSGPHRVLFFRHFVGNRILTLMSNLFTDLNLTDMETGFKAFRRELFSTISIEENRFGFEPEITAKIARLRCRLYEVPISYFGRDYSQGKKITWKDGIAALYFILKYNLRRRS